MNQHTPLNQLTSAQVADALRIIREEVKPILQESIDQEQALSTSLNEATAVRCFWCGATHNQWTEAYGTMCPKCRALAEAKAGPELRAREGINRSHSMADEAILKENRK